MAGPIPPGALLRQIPAAAIGAERHLWGFRGLHGGLTLALLASVMRRGAPGPARLRSATARFHRPLSEPFGIETAVLRSGGVTTLSARAGGDSVVHADASAIFGVERPGACMPLAPPAPPAPPPADCEQFRIPPEFVPISAFMEIRPVGPNRPYAGCAAPELTAWIRLAEDDEPPDSYRLIMLMDALAPSYAAVLTELQLIPTVELTVRLARSAQRASSPWILLHARTRWTETDGWLEEQIDAWDPDGVHLASAHQLRVVRTPASLAGGGQAERVALGVGEHDPGVAAWLEVGPGRSQRDHLLGRALEVGDREVQVGVLGRVGPAGGLVPLHPLEAELDRAVAEDDVGLIGVGDVQAGQLAVEPGERGRIGAVDDDHGERRVSRHGDDSSMWGGY
jgi:hypothetical protein